MVAAIPLTVWMARKIPPTGSVDWGVRSHSRSSWLHALMCSRLSARNSSAYCDRSMSAEHALHRFQHARGLERLDDEVFCSGLDRFDDQRLLAHRAAHQDLRVRVTLDDLAHGVDAAHVGHHDVHGDEVRLQLLVLLHALPAGLRFADNLEP